MEFDDSWINKYEMTQQSKRTLKVFYCYVDKDGTLHKINQEFIEITGNILKRDELLRMIVTNKRKHQLISILTYIVGDIDSKTDFRDFLQSNKIEDINIPVTPKAMETTNSIFFMFQEYSKKLKSNDTRKVVIRPSRNTRRKVLKAKTPEL